MSLLDWSRDERKAAIRNMANGKMKLLSVDWVEISVPAVTVPVFDIDAPIIYIANTDTVGESVPTF